MKTWKSFGRVMLLAGFCALGSFLARGQTPEQTAAAKDLLAKVAPADLAARAAQLVADAPPKEKAPVAAAIGHVVASSHPDLASAVVASICARVPVVAPAAAASAAARLPDSAAAIAVSAASVPGVRASDVRAAVIAAVPRQAVQIVGALSKARLTSRLEGGGPGRMVWQPEAQAAAQNRGIL